MLLQCVAGEIELPPALPRAWSTGSVRGPRARGGFEVDIVWRDGALVSARIEGAPGGSTTIRYGDRVRTVRVGEGRSLSLRGETLR